MVIKWFRELRGESALNFGDRPATSMSKFSVGMNSDLGNGSFCVEIRDANHVDVVEDLQEFDCINWPLISWDVYFFGISCIRRVWKQF